MGDGDASLAIGDWFIDLSYSSSASYLESAFALKR